MKKLSLIALLLVYQCSLYTMYNPFFDAIQHQGVTTVLSIIASDPKIVHVRDAQGNTALHKAAEYGLEAKVSILLSNGADSNVCNNDGDTPLHKSIDNGKVETALVLIKDVRTLIDAPNKLGNTPLHRASFKGQLSVVKALLGREVLINRQNHAGDTPLHCAIENRQEGVVQELISNECICVEIANGNGDRPIHRMAFYGLFCLDRLIIDRYADIAAEDGRGNTLLHILVETQNKSLVRHFAKLLGVNTLNGHGDSPLHRAASLPDSEITSCLLGSGANVMVQNGLKFTPLHCAVINRHLENVALLVKAKGIDLNALRYAIDRNFKKVLARTALSDALTGFAVDPRIADLLVQTPGVDFNLPDEDKRTPLMNAIINYSMNKHESMLNIIKFLLAERNLDVDACDTERCTALHHAVRSPCALELVPLLLTRPLKSIEAQNNAAETAFMIAHRTEHPMNGKGVVVDMLKTYDLASVTRLYEQR